MEFLRGVREAIRLAGQIGTTRLNTLVGVLPSGVSDDQARRTAVVNLAAVAPLAHDAGITLLVEGINNVDIPGYWAGSVAAAAGLVEAVDHPSVRIQLDQYHAAMAGEDAIECLHAYLPLIAHVQIADAPGRHEPGTGSQPIEAFLDELDRVGYDGFVALEYRPLVDTHSSLHWLRTYQADRL
jgi:hydroxypyruvate isomerase